MTDKRDGVYVDEAGNELARGVPLPPPGASQLGDDPFATADPVRSVGVRILVVWYEKCRAHSGAEETTRLWWGPPAGAVDPMTLVPDAYQLAVSQVLPPISMINPPAEAPYRLGLWLAVVNQGRVEATASVSPSTYARTTATLRGTTFDFGPHGSVSCDGFGVPIADDDLDSVDPGPCGFTFITDHGETVDIVITSAWRVVTVTSDGRTVTHDDLRISSTVADYEIYEIVTVGAPNP